jgi:hypothetical protein
MTEFYFTSPTPHLFEAAGQEQKKRGNQAPLTFPPHATSAVLQHIRVKFVIVFGQKKKGAVAPF